jgi:hypothetical protein
MKEVPLTVLSLLLWSAWLRSRLTANSLQPANKLLAIPLGQNLVSLRRVVQPAGLVLLHESHGIHPAKGIDKGIETSMPEFRWIQQHVSHDRTSAANSTTPSIRTLIKGPAFRAAAIKRSSQVAKASAEAFSALAT